MSFRITELGEECEVLEEQRAALEEKCAEAEAQKAGVEEKLHKLTQVESKPTLHTCTSICLTFHSKE